MIRSCFAAAALAAPLLLAVPAAAQDDETEAPSTYVVGDDGAATHNATGATCPPMVGELQMLQVLSFDREGDHLGISCQYLSERGFTASISFLRADEPSLVGTGGPAARWNRSLYQILGNYPAALPANVGGLEGDTASGLRGALFTANANGLPVRVGLWQIDDGNWVFRAQTVFTPNGDSGWQTAEDVRAALIAAQSTAN